MTDLERDQTTYWHRHESLVEPRVRRREWYQHICEYVLFQKEVRLNLLQLRFATFDGPMLTCLEARVGATKVWEECLTTALDP
jgi:hypothetical protein